MKKYALLTFLCAAAYGQWNSAYWYPGPEPASAIPWSKYTHVIQAVANVNSNGTFDSSELTPYASTIISAGHAAGKKVLWSLLDGDTGNMAGATSSANMNTFVNNIVNFTNQYGYDGVDLDWEASLTNATVPQYESLIAQLRSAMPNKIITMFAYDSSQLIAVSQNKQSSLDQINVGCYGLWGQALPYFFYDDAINGNTPMGNFGGCANRMNNMYNGGVAKAKMGVGMPFFGYRFTGCTQALQTTCTTSPGYFTYRDLVSDSTRWQSQYQFYDNTYKSNYLSIPSLNEWDPFSGIQFMSDVTAWGKAQGYGGYMVFTQDNEYLPSQTGDAAYPLSTALYTGIYGAGTAPSITTTSLPSGTTGTAYSATLTATGATSIAWSIASGSLPPGLTLSSGGAITGTPTTSGTFNFTVQATNTANSLSSTQALSIVINLGGVAPAITTSSLATGTVGTAYSQTLAVTGTAPITWSPSTLSLPAGLSWNPSTATISGTPTVAATGTYTFTATNSWGTATKALSLSINASSPSGPFAYWKLDEGSGTTAGDSSGYGHTATLSNGPAWQSGGNCIAGSCLSFNGTNQYGSVGLDLSTTSAVTIAFWMNWSNYANDDRLAMEFSSNFNSVTTGFMVDPNSANGGGGQFEAGVNGDGGYNQVLFARPSAGWHHYAFVLNKSAAAATQVIPYVDGVAVSYTKPTSAANTNNFAADTLYLMSRGGSSLFGNGTLDEVQINTSALSASQIQTIATTYKAPAAPTITTTSLPQGTVGSSYSQQLSATGTVTWSIVSGSLPAGLSLNSSTGVISGTPSASGTSNFTVQASNSSGTATQALSIVIVGNPPVITTTSLPSGTVGTPYSQTVAATGTGPITWSVTSGALPAGLSLNSTTGVISGTPSATGTSNFTVQASNSSGTATQALSIAIAGNAPVITTTSLPSGTVGTPYSQTVAATGTGPITWSVTNGALPAGLSLNSTTGTISGTPTAGNSPTGGGSSGSPTGGASTTFTIQASNASGTATQALSITINNNGTPPAITTTSLASGTVGTAYSQAVAATGTTPITWSISSGALPAGLSLNSTTGTISGTPTAAGSSSFTITASNAAGTASQALSISIINNATPPAITTTSLPSGTIGRSYSQTLAATGTTPIKWSITSGALPAGLSLNSTTGTISGTPTSTGTSSFRVSASNSAGTASASFSLTIRRR